MSTEHESKRNRALLWLNVKGVALIVTGYLAAVGMTFVCVIRDALSPHQLDFRLMHEQPPALYAALFVAMAIWLLVAGRFAWRNRTRLGMTLSAIAFAVFAYSAWKVYIFAYPVCNAF